MLNTIKKTALLLFMLAIPVLPYLIVPPDDAEADQATNRNTVHIGVGYSKCILHGAGGLANSQITATAGDAGTIVVRVTNATATTADDAGSIRYGCPMDRRVRIAKVRAVFQTLATGTSQASKIVLSNSARNLAGPADAGRTTIAVCTSTGDGGTAGRWKAGTVDTCTLSGADGGRLDIDIGELMVQEFHPGALGNKIPNDTDLEIWYADQYR